MNKCKVGELRPSQMLYNFGVGGVVDLPLMSALILGLDEWDTTHMRKLPEERLLAAVKKRLGPQVGFLAQAPLRNDSATNINPYDPAAYVGIPVATFPGWIICPVCHRLAPIEAGNTGSFELKHNPFRWQETHYVHQNCQLQASSKKKPVIPSRFIVACKQGHLDDFPWVYFVHGGNTNCKSILKLTEYGVSGTAADIFVVCTTCNAKRNMSEAFGESGRANMPKCRGRHPHLNLFAGDGCEEQMQAMLLGASNLWFPVTLSALAIPNEGGQLADLIDKNWSFLQGATDKNILQILLSTFQNNGQLTDLMKYATDDIWNLIEQKKSGQAQPDAPIDMKVPEWEVFSNPNPAANTGDFELEQTAAPVGYEQYFEKVVLVRRLREVTALIGFTRIESPVDFRETMEDVPNAPVSRGSATWLPAIEVRGEGIFIQFKEELLRQWESGKGMQEYQQKTADAHISWCLQRSLDPKIGMPNARLLLIHTFAHALMQQFAIECGYNVASLRERIYSRLPSEEGEAMAGVLIYTAAPDSEGTLGGLVALGEPNSLGRHLDQALERMRLCASDPLCAEHNPMKATGTLHWAACHSCLFSPETSCEKGNKFLDRALLIPTIRVSERAFFQ